MPVAPVRFEPVGWTLVGAAIAVQIAYPLMPETLRTEVTVTSVVAFFLAVVADVARLHGVRGVVSVIGIAGAGGLIAEAVGVATGWPFGDYSYTGSLGLQILGVPVVVPLAWVMMAWPALTVARTLATRRWVVVAVGAYALTSWDVFLDPQMVAAGHWTWVDPAPTLPLIPDVPLTNYLGWLLVSAVMIALLDRVIPPQTQPSGPAATLYLWVYFSSVMGHAVFFGLPGSAVTGGVIMGLVAVPFAVTVWRAHVRNRT